MQLALKGIDFKNWLYQRVWQHLLLLKKLSKISAFHFTASVTLSVLTQRKAIYLIFIIKK